jgi:hypothetical protein
VKDRVHLLSDVLIQNHQRRLVVEGQRPIVEIHRPDGGPEAIDHECLGVKRCGLPLVNAHAGFQQRFILCATGQADGSHVGAGAAGQDTHVHTAPRCGGQEPDEVFVRCEV